MCTANQNIRCTKHPLLCIAGGLLPPVMSDPVLLFVLLVEACMPSAQVRRKLLL